ncbi:MAG: sigma-70 family RNA polymerase sigma factor [Actinomycetota bacterium]
MSITESGFVTGEHPIVTTAVPCVDFDEFYGATRQAIIRALSATLGSNDLAIDATDEALARAVQRWERVGRLDNPAGWVYRVGLNYARNRVRARLRRQPLADLSDSSAPSPDTTVADPAVGEALARLSLDHRSVVVCRFLLDWSEQQTADALAIRRGTVKSRLSRALAKLERHLAHLRMEES